MTTAKGAAMLFGAYEFEIVMNEDGYLALPYDLGGGTRGKDFDELCRMVVDWLKLTLEDHDMHHKPLPAPTYGNGPRYGGTNMIFAVQAGRETVERVTASTAARMLGVTPGRVTQLMSSYQLEGWREGRNTYVTLASVEARLQERARDSLDRSQKEATV